MHNVFFFFLEDSEVTQAKNRNWLLQRHSGLHDTSLENLWWTKGNVRSVLSNLEMFRSLPIGCPAIECRLPSMQPISFVCPSQLKTSKNKAINQTKVEVESVWHQIADATLDPKRLPSDLWAKLLSMSVPRQSKGQARVSYSPSKKNPCFQNGCQAWHLGFLFSYFSFSKPLTFGVSGGPISSLV